MNVKTLFDYMQLCEETGVEPTFDGLRAFDKALEITAHDHFDQFDHFDTEIQCEEYYY